MHSNPSPLRDSDLITIMLAVCNRDAIAWTRSFSVSSADLMKVNASITAFEVSFCCVGSDINLIFWFESVGPLWVFFFPTGYLFFAVLFFAFFLVSPVLLWIVFVIFFHRSFR